MRQIAVSENRVNAGEVGPAPMLQWLKITDLVVDDSYQRDLKRENWTAIRKIAANFRWSRFSPVFCAPVEGGVYAIIDGQHRTHAAALCGIESVPCQVVQMTREEQAQAFAAVNGAVTKVTLWNIYKAALAAGLDWAVDIRAAAADAGCRVMENNASTSAKKAGEIYAIEGFRREVERAGREKVTAVLKALRSCKAWGQEAVYWEASILLPILDVLCRHADLVAREDFQSRFETWPLWKIIDEISERSKAAVRSGQECRPKREQLQDNLRIWLRSNFKPASAQSPTSNALVPVRQVAAPPASLAPVIVDKQRQQLDEARKRRARLGFKG